MKTLVVDDHGTAVCMLDRLLSSWNFQVSTASSGDQALQAVLAADAAGAPFELVLLDWKMPGLNGLDVVRELNTAAGEGRIQWPPIVTMVTAHDREQLLREAGSLKLAAVLTKPVIPSALFNVILRLQQPERQLPAATRSHLGPRETLAAIRGAAVLVVEDNPMNQDVARLFLSQAGIQVTVADNGAQAVALVSAGHYDAVLMDLHMPVMDGLEATRRIRQLPHGQTLPIIAMTAAAMTQDKLVSIAAGMNAHIAKPVDPQELADKLCEWIPARTQAPVAQSSQPTTGPSDEIATLEQSLPGIAVRASLVRLQHSPAGYREMLQGFARRQQTCAQELQARAAASDADGLFRLAHELAGEAGALGLEEVHSLAQELTHAIKNHHLDGIADLSQRLAVAVSRALALIQRLPEAEPASAPVGAAIPIAELLPLLETLRGQLASKNYAATQTTERIRGLLVGTDLARPFQEVAQAIGALDYDKAQAALRQFVAAQAGRGRSN